MTQLKDTWRKPEMMTPRNTMIGLVMVVVAVSCTYACTSDGDTEHVESRYSDIGKDEARRLAEEGEDVDFCAIRGWDADGVCDDFCLRPDPDCDGTNERQCFADSECARGQFCDLPACGLADGPGVCRNTGGACTRQWDPVCGCDGETYGNACSAHAAGVGIEYAGECNNGGGGECGGPLDVVCPDGQYCAYERAGYCGQGLETGTCTERPEACYDIWAPVCGCDGVTYGNDCEAAAAGANILHEGECESGGQECGGPLDNTCGPGEYCAYERPGYCGEGFETGVCQRRPDACPENYDPVCGCDGRTYGNACDAAANGANVVHHGACDEPRQECGGVLTVVCPDGQYCQYPEGASCGENGETGVCAERPLGCPDVWDPVCGCDGQTHSNACDAAAAGVSVLYAGECRNSSQVCGGIAGIQCEGENEYCNFGSHCGEGDQQGVCEPRPEVCTDEWAPVCGCDGRTYGNRCEAAAAGASVVHEGECGGGPVECGGPLTVECPDGTFCSYSNTDDADSCGETGLPGICVSRPDACPAIYAPVCGCDGQTYSNSCVANANGVNVQRDGACNTTQVCGGILGLTCSDDQYCNYGDHCGEGDQQGVCETRPQACPDVWDPVCGCDGQTYGNTCEAAAAGVTAASRGACNND